MKSVPPNHHNRNRSNKRQMDSQWLMFFVMNRMTGQNTYIEIMAIVILIAGVYIVREHKHTLERMIPFLFSGGRIKSEYTISFNRYQKPSAGWWQTFEKCSEPIPYEYLAIMKMICSLKPLLRSGNNINKGNRRTENYDVEYELDEPHGVKLSKDISVRTHVKENAEFKEFVQVTKTMTITSTTYDYHQLLDVIRMWTQEYLKNKDAEVDCSKIYYCEYDGLPKKDDDRYPNDDDQIVETKYFMTEFNTNKNFNNTFFEEKKQLLGLLDTFTNNRQMYIDIGKPHTLGLMFSGLAGSGKTSTIKAIAKYTNRNIISIQLNKIKKSSELIKIFTDPYVNKMKIPINRRIYVFEDIDCMTDIVRPRKSDDKAEDDERCDKKKKETDNKQIVIIGKDSDIKKMEHPDKTGVLTLQTILNLFDGLMEQEGRIIILTTNYPEKLDHALIRPGRIDHHIKFTHCTTKLISEIFGFYYTVYHKTPADHMADVLRSIECSDCLDGKFSSAEVIGCCIANTDPKDAIDQMMRIKNQ
jgi:hypothetical protein